MKYILRNSIILLLLSFLFSAPVNVHALERKESNDIVVNKMTCELKMQERKLWLEHVLWTRSFIVSDLSDLGDKDAVLERLLKNQEDIGNSIKPYYGEEAGNKLTSLLREHIQIAGQVTDAAKSGNKANLEKYNTLWYENADEIADFLSSANPNYSNQDLKDMLHKHLEFVTNQVVARLNKDWNGDITEFDKGEEHMIKFADILIDGIIKQFPDKFE